MQMIWCFDKVPVIMSQSPQKQYFTLGRTTQQIIRDGSFATKKEYLETQLFNHHIAENNIRIQGLIRKLHAAYIHQKIPDFYSYFFLGQIVSCSEQRIEDSINRQIQLLRTKQCHYNSIMRTINARESCLKSLQRCLEPSFQESDKNLLNNFREEINHYRQLTSLAVEQIKQWKQYLLQINSNVYGDQHIAFFYQGKDFLLKVLNDVDFISQSFLSSKITFSYKQDPFILRPFTQSQAIENIYLQMLRFEPEQRARYVNCLQFLADQRADYFKRRISVKEERIKQIERAYQSKTLPSKILLSRPQYKIQKKQKEIVLDIPIDFVQEPKDFLKESRRSSSLSELKESKLKNFLMKGEKIKKIKEMKIGEPPALINPKRFGSIERQEENSSTLIPRSISLSFIKKSSFPMQKSERKEKDSDFESLVRQKELQILQADNIRRKTFSSIKLNDKLSERKLIAGEEGAQELQKILDQFEQTSSQKDQGFLKKRILSSKSGKTLMQHNQQVILNLRKQVLKEIQDHEGEQKRLQKMKEEERDQMHKIIKEKLEKKTLLDIEKEKAKWTEGKDLLAFELGKKEIFGYSDPSSKKSQKLSQLQNELRKQMQLKWLREVHEELNHRQSVLKAQKEKKKEDQERERQLEVVKRKKEQEIRFAEIEREERFKVTDQLLKRQEDRKKEIELEMEEVVWREKEKLHTFSMEQKNQLQNELKQTMKVSLLTKLRREKSMYTQQIKEKQAKKLQEQAHREEARRKLEAEFEIQKQLQRQKEREQKKKKMGLVAQKLQHIGEQLQKQKFQRQSSIKPGQLQNLKKSITNIPDLRNSEVKPLRQQHKKRLREQFELELFAFNREGPALQNNFLGVNKQSKLADEENLNVRMTELEEQIKKGQEEMKMERENSRKLQKEQLVIEQQEGVQAQLIPKRSSQKAAKEDSNSQNFVRFSEDKSEDKEQDAKQPTITQSDLKKIGVDMSPIEYMMYIKKKAAIDAKKIVPINEQKERKKLKKVLEQFEIMEDLNFEIKRENSKEEKQVQEQRHFNEENTQEIKNKVKQREQNMLNVVKIEENKMKKKDQDSEQLSDIMKLTVHSKMNAMKKKRFVTSDDSESSESPRIRRRKKIPQKQRKIEKQIKNQSVEDASPPKPLQRQEAKFSSVPQDNLQDYLITHFKRLPKLIRRLNLYKKDELLKTLLECKNVMIIQVRKGEEIQGIGFIAQNQNKPALRSLNFLHIGSYQSQNMISVIVKMRDLVFATDPCSQITFSMYFEKQDEEQNKFIKQFEKKFDPYGAIFQKKINNEQTQRKHILRRMIGEECVNVIVQKSSGQLKVSNHFIANFATQSLGVNLGLSDLESSLGGWTMLSLFLSRFGDQAQLQEYLSADVKEENKILKYLSKMALKLRKSVIRDLDYFQFDNPFHANIKLLEEKEDILKCDPSIQEQQIPIKWMRLSLTLQPALPFDVSAATIRYKGEQIKMDCLRFKCGKGSKVMKLKSSLYSSQVIVIPCKPTNYKLLLVEAAELDSMKNASLDLYLKLFLANADRHTLSDDEHIWIPQFQSQQFKSIQLAEQFGFRNEFRNKSALKFTHYVENGIEYAPTHKDIVVTPPFILAVLNSEVERLTESSPIYIQRIDLNNLVGLKSFPKPAEQSDF